MTIETHVTDRKALVRQIAELLHQEFTYTGVPTCAYRIGPVTVDRGGAIHTDDSIALATLKPFLIEQGYIIPEPESEPEATPEPEAASEPEAAPYTEAVDTEVAPEPAVMPAEESEIHPEPGTAHPDASDIERMEISMLAEGMTVAPLKNLIFTLYSKQYLINRATCSDVLSISDGVVSRLKEYTPETPEAFSELLADFKALGELDGFDFQGRQRDDGLPPRCGAPGKHGRRTDSCSTAFVKAALAADRVFPKKQQPENEKYYMRSWLIRLGLGGVEFKALRSLMLKKLKGYTAFPDDAAAQKHREKYAEIRRASREGQVEAE